MMPPVVRLLEGEVAQPVTEEAVDVEQEGGGGREGSDVARPAESLIALRAVGRHARKLPRIPHTTFS